MNSLQYIPEDLQNTFKEVAQDLRSAIENSTKFKQGQCYAGVRFNSDDSLLRAICVILNGRARKFKEYNPTDHRLYIIKLVKSISDDSNMIALLVMEALFKVAWIDWYYKYEKQR